GDEHVAVIDIGGGATRATILDVAGDRFAILAHDVDPWLSALDFDTELAQAVADDLWRRTRIELRRDPLAWQRLGLACEDVKPTLAIEAQAMVSVEQVVMTPRPIDLRHRIDRVTFARLVQPVLERVAVVYGRALGDAGIKSATLSRIIVVGGVARLPFV